MIYKNFVLFSLVMSFTVSCYGNDFLNADYGMTREQIKKIETSQFKEADENGVYYISKINNVNVQIVYMFLENKLFSGLIGIDYKNLEKDHQAIKEYLIKTHGPPEITNFEALKPQNIKGDNLDTLMDWKTKTGTISYMVNNGNNNIKLFITYMKNW